jgi:hypothetical protein
LTPHSAYRAGSFDGPIANVKVKEVDESTIALGFTAYIDNDGDIFNEKMAPKPKTTAREYKNVLVRFWDTYFTAQKSVLFYTVLERDPKASRWSVVSAKPTNAFAGTNLELPWLPNDALGGGGDYDMSKNAIIVTTRDPGMNPAVHIGDELYYIPLSSFRATSPDRIDRISVPDHYGSATSAVFSHRGDAIAFAKGRFAGDEFTPNSLILMNSPEPSRPLHFKIRSNLDRLVGTIKWASDDRELWFTAEDQARTKLWSAMVGSSVQLSEYKCISQRLGSVNSFYNISDPDSDSKERKWLINTTSLTNAGTISILTRRTDPDSSPSLYNLLDCTHQNPLGISRSQIFELSVPGEQDTYSIHTWLIKPSFFNPAHTYPLALHVHGGPAGTWSDAWSTRWNPLVWAEQGYVVVLPNPTGSTSFGHAYSAAIKADWGGRCYRDIERVHAYVEEHYGRANRLGDGFVDMERAVLGGASFGGYMANWINGRPLGRRFGAIVSHDGIFSLYSMLASDIVAGWNVNLGGDLWDPDTRALVANNDPSQNLEGWQTPMLVIHSDGDFRCPMSEGLSAYMACQVKGVESRFLNFPDENHFVLKRENSYRWYSVVLGWANRFAEVKGEGVVREEEWEEGGNRPVGRR